MERYIPSKPFWSFPLSSKVPLIFNGMSCLIFQTSRWPFQKITRFWRCKSCLRIKGSWVAALCFNIAHTEEPVWPKQFKVVPPMHRSWKEVRLCQLPLRTVSQSSIPQSQLKWILAPLGCFGGMSQEIALLLLALLLISTAPTKKRR